VNGSGKTTSNAKLAQLFTRGVDQLTPLRSHTVTRLDALRPVVWRESHRTGVNPMLLAAILFDEMQHAKPGEDLPLAAHSGLFSTHGPAQLGLSEMVKQGLLREDASPEEVAEARDQLLDPFGTRGTVPDARPECIEFVQQFPRQRDGRLFHARHTFGGECRMGNGAVARLRGCSPATHGLQPSPADWACSCSSS
jgi:hypothetical protein